MKLIVLFNKLALLIVSILFSFISAELFLNIYGYKIKNIKPDWFINDNYYLPDGELFYSVKKNINNKKNNIYTNNLGLKTTPWQNTKFFDPIIILGDSFVWGNTEYDNTYPQQLEEFFLINQVNTQVINTGISGYGTDQEYLFFTKRILPIIKPSVLIWNININDIEDNIDRPIFDIRKNKLIQIPAWKNGYYLNAILKRITLYHILNNSKLVNFISDKLQNRRLYKLDYKDPIEWSAHKMQIEFNEMEKIAKKNKFKLIFAISPSQNIIENIPKKNSDLELVSLIKITIGNRLIIDQNKYLLEKSTTYNNKNILGLSTKKENLFIDESLLFPKGFHHLNKQGNYFMALSIFEFLKKSFN